MSTNGARHVRSRQPEGRPTGGRYAEERKAASGLALADDDEHQPVDLDDGEELILDGDRQVVDHYDLQRDGNEYLVSGVVNAGTITYLLGAEEAGYDHTEKVMNQGRWGAMSHFFIDRYEGAELDLTGDGDALRCVVDARFDHAPSPAEAVETVWPTAARIANETDRGTFGAPFAGDDLVRYLDEQAFLPPLTYLDNPVTTEQAHQEACSAYPGGTISDESAVRIAEDLAATPGVPGCYRELARRGYAAREALSAATRSANPTQATATRSALVLANWARAQPKTSDLLNGKEASRSTTPP